MIAPPVIQTSRISPADLSDPDDVRALLALHRSAGEHDLPGDPPITLVELRNLLTDPYRGRRVVLVHRDPDGAISGCARLAGYGTPYEKVLHGTLLVRPDRRRQGVGRALLAAARRFARGTARIRLVLEGSGNPAVEFAAACGLQLAVHEVRSRLDLVTLDLVDLAVRANAPQDGYTVAGWRGRCPSALITGYGEALAVLHADTSDGAGPPITAAELRHRETSAATAGVVEYTACVIHEPSGRLVALSTLQSFGGPRAEQGDTVVLPGHRGRGLAQWVKAVLLDVALPMESGLRMIDTYNATNNGPMLAVNKRLGFVPMGEHYAWQAGV